MAETREAPIRECPHCGSSCAVGPGARECPCCGQGYGAQGLADHMLVPDEDAHFAPAALAALAVVALIVAAVVVTPLAPPAGPAAAAVAPRVVLSPPPPPGPGPRGAATPRALRHARPAA